jgi:hypothetical protein
MEQAIMLCDITKRVAYACWGWDGIGERGGSR